MLKRVARRGVDKNAPSYVRSLVCTQQPGNLGNYGSAKMTKVCPRCAVILAPLCRCFSQRAYLMRSIKSHQCP